MSSKYDRPYEYYSRSRSNNSNSEDRYKSGPIDQYNNNNQYHFYDNKKYNNNNNNNYNLEYERRESSNIVSCSHGMLKPNHVLIDVYNNKEYTIIYTPNKPNKPDTAKYSSFLRKNFMTN